MWHTATRLTDGRILLVGGSQAVDDFLADVDIFDPITGQTSRAASLHRPRHAHSATLLRDGRVLVIGGYSLPWQWLNDAEVYDPVANTWTVVSPLYSHGSSHTATLMEDGRVLVVAGNIGSSMMTNRVEIFDPLTNTWSEAQPLSANRWGHTAQLLEDGRVLVAGGTDDPLARMPDGDSQLYDPQANSWTATGPMVEPRFFAQSVRLPDGRVLVASGFTIWAVAVLASAEIYNPASNTWMAAADLAQGRYGFNLELLPSSQVLAVGGALDWGGSANSYVRELRKIELYDPAANEWRTIGELQQPRAQAAATLLPDGRVWLTGGRWSATGHAADSWFIGYGVPGTP